MSAQNKSIDYVSLFYCVNLFYVVIHKNILIIYEYTPNFNFKILWLKPSCLNVTYSIKIISKVNEFHISFN